ncbi:MAG: GNAT family N-acetyltransferase [Clostridia bacterium]|nr:GNAT family N-acetyltransferase [Clostridia bacterium]
MDGQLVGACYSAAAAGCTCVDGLIVDEAFRNRRVATSLLSHVTEQAKGSLVFLHADAQDTPKDLYEKLGFTVADRLYEYLCTDLSKYSDC